MLCINALMILNAKFYLSLTDCQSVKWFITWSLDNSAVSNTASTCKAEGSLFLWLSQSLDPD